MLEVCNILTHQIVGPALSSVVRENRLLMDLMNGGEGSNYQSKELQMERILLLQEIENMSTVSSS
jgi:hypothetical protein